MSDGQLVLGGDYEEKKVTRLREVRLSVAEAAELGVEVGRLAEEIEVHKKAAKEAEAKQDDAIAKLRKNSTAQDVDCSLRLYYANRLVQVLDGEEVIEERAMTDDEFQRDLPLQNGVVLPPEEDENEESDDLTSDEQQAAAKQDLEDVIREEKNPNKPSLVDMN